MQKPFIHRRYAEIEEKFVRRINMKHKNAFKFLLDACMMLALTIFFNKRSLGMSFHEIGGLILLATLAFRVLLNYKWVVGVTRKFFSKAVPITTKSAPASYAFCIPNKEVMPPPTTSGIVVFLATS